MDERTTAAALFAPGQPALEITEFGNGNINRTFLVKPKSGAGKPFLLQRLNTHVFRHPNLVMANMTMVTGHVHRQLAEGVATQGRRWAIPRVLITHDGFDHWRAQDGSFWRAISFIEGTKTIDIIPDPEHAREIGFALGMFHSLLSDLPTETLADTLPGFHITPGYLDSYDAVRASCKRTLNPEETWCDRFVEKHRAWAPILEKAREEGRLKLRPIHGDPKVNNILLDKASGKAIGMIDLDTVKPGLIQYDIGDCLRSSCNPLGEETPDWDKVRFDPDLARAVLEGYGESARRFLTPEDVALVPDAIRLIAFELGVRFFADHLAGDLYFKAARPGHNLARALVQLKLAESIDSQMGSIRAVARSLQ